MKSRRHVLVWLLFLAFQLEAESLRVMITGDIQVSLHNPEGVSIPLSYVSSVVIALDQEVRFFRGVSLELTAPQTFLPYYGSLAMVLYANLGTRPGPGIADIEARQISFDLVPNKIQSVYHIPLRTAHGLRTTPYTSVPTGIIPSSEFPILFRLMPVIKGLSEEVESMEFQLHVKPILANEGAVRIAFRYPEQLPGKPFILLLDDVLIERPFEEQLLREGEHHLVILSEAYRNENRRFLVERGKILDITVELQDPTPLIIFEAPENARIYFDNEPVEDTRRSYPVEPGGHEVKFQMSDYSIIRPLTVQKGKTYKVALMVDVMVSESE
ncbi:MAG: hypothetical protein LBD74_07635 [Spirochaetaceae bacterium]|jgi:hypothetical protein|nr:hypothetical protein [Spirochaetaceae bacterium]